MLFGCSTPASQRSAYGGVRQYRCTCDRKKCEKQEVQASLSTRPGAHSKGAFAQQPRCWPAQTYTSTHTTHTHNPTNTSATQQQMSLTLQAIPPLQLPSLQHQLKPRHRCQAGGCVAGAVAPLLQNRHAADRAAAAAVAVHQRQHHAAPACCARQRHAAACGVLAMVRWTGLGL